MTIQEDDRDDDIESNCDVDDSLDAGAVDSDDAYGANENKKGRLQVNNTSHDFYHS